jgi:hypothetical protein
MGYQTSLSGGFTFDPPLSAVEYANSPYLSFGDKGSWSFKLDQPDAIVASDEYAKHYDLEEDLQAFVNSLPDRTFAGFIGGEGEENWDVWRLYVVDRRITKVMPETVWPADPTAKAPPVLDGDRVRVTLTTEYTGAVTDYEEGEFIRLGGHRIDLTDSHHVDIAHVAGEDA